MGRSRTGLRLRGAPGSGARAVKGVSPYQPGPLRQSRATQPGRSAAAGEGKPADGDKTTGAAFAPCMGRSRAGLYSRGAPESGARAVMALAHTSPGHCGKAGLPSPGAARRRVRAGFMSDEKRPARRSPLTWEKAVPVCALCQYTPADARPALRAACSKSPACGARAARRISAPACPPL